MRAADRTALRRMPAHGTWALLVVMLALPPSFGACDATDTPLDAIGSDVPGDAPPDVLAEEVPGGGGTFPENSTAAQIRALEEVNRFRMASGLGPVDAIESLNAASQAHADYLVGNCINYGNTGLSPHDENAAWPGFTGVTAMARAEDAGFQGIGNSWAVGEVIAFLNEPTLAVEGWVRTLYHRLPLLDPRTRQIGYGGANIGDGPLCTNRMLWNADVITIGMAGETEDAVILYPPDGSKRIPTSFDGLENPEPIRPLSGWPSGTIITVQFGQEREFVVTGHRLLEYGRDEVSHLIVASKADDAAGVLEDPVLSMYHDTRTLALYAVNPLKAGTDHTVIVDLVRGGEPLHLEWTFKTDYTQD